MYFSSSPVSLAVTPRSIARPMTAGIRAWESIHDDAEEDPAEHGPPLALDQPPQQPPRGPVVRESGVVEGEGRGTAR